jgi:hypothetical protein
LVDASGFSIRAFANGAKLFEGITRVSFCPKAIVADNIKTTGTILFIFIF